jgi:hypothetical protein
VRSATTSRFTATITWDDGGTPTPVGGGTVSFLNGVSPITGCEDVAVDGSGHAACATNALPAGTNTINASFSGYDIYDATTSSPIEQHVLLVPTITLTPSANPITEGDTLTLTVTITGTGPTPTGTVSVAENRCRGRCRSAGRTPPSIGTCTDVALVSGTATCTVSTLPLGETALYVDYSGDATYAARLGEAQYTQTVTVAPTTTTVTPATTAGGTGRTATTGADSIPITLVGFGLAVLGGLFMVGARLMRKRRAA